jgi:hypothetical protein
MAELTSSDDRAALCEMGAAAGREMRRCDGLVAEFAGVLIAALPDDGRGPLHDQRLPEAATVAALDRATRAHGFGTRLPS